MLRAPSGRDRRHLIISGDALVAAAVGLAGWRAATHRRWEELESGLRTPVAVLAVAGVALAVSVMVRSMLGRPVGRVAAAIHGLVFVVASVLAVDVVQRAVNDGAPVVDILLPIVTASGAALVLAGRGRLHRSGHEPVVFGGL